MKTYVKAGEEYILAYDSEAVMDAKEAVLKALEDVRAEIAGNLEPIVGKYDSNTKPGDMPSRKIERNNGRKEAIDIINRKIAEVKGDKA